jgi:uncharacterized protein
VVANPYHYGTPVSGEQFAGREPELAALEARMRDGVNVVVSSPRRYGKTSLLARASAQLVAEGAAVVSVNVLACKDVATFASRLAGQAYAVRGGRWHRRRQATAEFVARLRVSPSVTFEGDAPRFSFAATLTPGDADLIVEDVYALLGELSAKRPAVLILDEFPAITGLGEHLPALLKALADTHPNVCLVLAGSREHLMEQLTSERSAPLFGLAERFTLDVVPASVMATFLRERARAGGKSMSEATAALVVKLSGPVPNDIQRLAYEVWGVAGRSVTEAAVTEGMASAVEHEASGYSQTYGRLAPGQRRLLSALAAERTGVDEPYAAAFVRQVGLANAASVRRAMDALVEDELVTRRDGAYQVFDPFFAAWLTQTN